METEPIKQKVLVLCSRGVSHQQRHIIADIARMLPHSKKEAKINRKKNPSSLKDLAEMHSCNNIIYLEGRKKISFLWLAHYPNGPSVKFLLQSVHTSEELKLPGNYVRPTRPMLSFDSSFTKSPHLSLIQNLLLQIFNTPKNESKPVSFIDHIFSFSQTQNKIFFRNFEIVENNTELNLTEIGPRFVVTPIKILDGMMNGEVLYKNGAYVSPKKVIIKNKYEDSLKKNQKKYKNTRREFVKKF